MKTVIDPLGCFSPFSWLWNSSWLCQVEAVADNPASWKLLLEKLRMPGEAGQRLVPVKRKSKVINHVPG